jgi:hypothetical protein
METRFKNLSIAGRTFARELSCTALAGVDVALRQRDALLTHGLRAMGAKPATVRRAVDTMQSMDNMFVVLGGFVGAAVLADHEFGKQTFMHSLDMIVNHGQFVTSDVTWVGSAGLDALPRGLASVPQVVVR